MPENSYTYEQLLDHHRAEARRAAMRMFGLSSNQSSGITEHLVAVFVDSVIEAAAIKLKLTSGNQQT